MAKLYDFIIRWLNEESTPSELPLCDFERFRYELKPCDVVLVEGRSRVSGVIRLVTASPWTHAALYIGRIHDIEDAALREALERYCNFPANEQLIIESHLGKGTIVNKLSVYRQDHIRICRPSGLSYQDAQQVIKYAISRLGAEYDVRQIFDLARFLFPWFLLPRRWRSSLFKTNAGEGTRTVCSTMIAEAFGFIQFPILPLVKRTIGEGVQLFRRNPKLCVPSDFDYSPHFEIIKYPFIDVGFYKDYRLLPWKGSGSLSQEEANFYFEHGETIRSSSPKHQEPSDSLKSEDPQMATLAQEQKQPLMAFASVAPLRRVAGALPGGGRWREPPLADEETSKTTLPPQNSLPATDGLSLLTETSDLNESETQDSQTAGDKNQTPHSSDSDTTSLRPPASHTPEEKTFAQAKWRNKSEPAQIIEHTETKTSEFILSQASSKGHNTEEKHHFRADSLDDAPHTHAEAQPKPKQSRLNIVAIEKWIKNIKLGKNKPSSDTTKSE